MRKNLLFLAVVALSFVLTQCTTTQKITASKMDFISQDSLRGSIGPGRDWWDVMKYDITVEPNYVQKTIAGKVVLSYKRTKSQPTNGYMQIDLQDPMKLDSAIYNNQSLSFEKNGNTWRIQYPTKGGKPQEEITLYYSGNPRVAKNAPWDGGWIFASDAEKRPWMTVACQGLGSSVWYPCKDHQSDEPDNGATLTIITEKGLTGVGNGRLVETKDLPNERVSWKWEVKNPINNYNIIPYIGHYVNFTDVYKGEKGNLDLSYWVLDYNLEKAKKQFGQDVKPMMKTFEEWFGPYPFYEDSYKLVESSHLGMEHQSAVAYGNKYQNGYLGRDLSGSGWGKDWDYIIIHETGHEWFGNNITAKDVADMWIQEGFTTYSEVVFVEGKHGKIAGDEYARGLRRSISNRAPVQGVYGINQEGSGDMYYKGANMIHTIRTAMNDDAKFKKVLRGVNEKLYHKTTDRKEFVSVFNQLAGKDFTAVFNQYLDRTTLPVLEYKISGTELEYRWSNCVDKFDLPLKLEKSDKWLQPTTEWKKTNLTKEEISNFSIHPNFYISTKKL